jgi:hypothetical protein
VAIDKKQLNSMAIIILKINWDFMGASYENMWELRKEGIRLCYKYIGIRTR